MAGGHHDIYRRCELLREIESDSNGNVLFPPVALRDPHVFVAFYADYYFSKSHGHQDEAAALVDSCMLRMLNRVHHAAMNGVLLPLRDREAFFTTASAIYSDTGLSAAAC